MVSDYSQCNSDSQCVSTLVEPRVRTMLTGLEFRTFASSARMFFLCLSHCFKLRWFEASGIIAQLTQEFHMSDIVAILTLSLFVTGYCVGYVLCHNSVSVIFWTIWKANSMGTIVREIWTTSYFHYFVLPLCGERNQICIITPFMYLLQLW